MTNPETITTPQQQFIEYVKGRLPEGEEVAVYKVEGHEPLCAVQFERHEGDEVDQWYYFGWINVDALGHTLGAFGLCAGTESDNPFELIQEDRVVEFEGQEAQEKLDEFKRLVGVLLKEEIES